MLNITIREEKPTDVEEIRELTAKAFADKDYSNQTEHFVIDALRAAGVLTISLVALLDEQIVGHNAFSPIEISDGTKNWYAMGPLSVLPQYQRLGIGGMLIREGLAKLKALNAGGCYLVGDSRYYPRFGFENVEGLYCEGRHQRLPLLSALPVPCRRERFLTTRPFLCPVRCMSRRIKSFDTVLSR